jgi:hypothetical protein
MGKVILIGVALLVIIIAVQFLPDVLTASHEARTDEDAVSANITTGAGEVTGTVNLTETLWESDLGSVVSITSTQGSDTPAAQSYDSTNNRITVSGLTPSLNRVITLTHEYAAADDFVGLDPLLAMGATLIALVLFLGIPAAIIWKMFGSRG